MRQEVGYSYIYGRQAEDQDYVYTKGMRKEVGYRDAQHIKWPSPKCGVGIKTKKRGNGSNRQMMQPADAVYAAGVTELK